MERVWTITGQDDREGIWWAAAIDGEVDFIRRGAPIMRKAGGRAQGNLCPDGAVVKVAGLKNQVFEGVRESSRTRGLPSDAVSNQQLRGRARFWCDPQ